LSTAIWHREAGIKKTRNANNFLREEKNKVALWTIVKISSEDN
jgi:hypothetical protein